MSSFATGGVVRSSKRFTPNIIKADVSNDGVCGRHGFDRIDDRASEYNNGVRVM
ncbi:hypothetical protein Hanom_Chr05g00417911 [Helianthus anomalus]